MDPTIHDVLDGRCSRDEVPSEELRELAALEGAIDAVAGPIRSAPVPDLSAGVMMRLAEVRRARSGVEKVAAAARRTLDGLWTPRPLTVRVRPAYALAAVGVIAVLAALAPRATAPPLRESLRAGAEEAPVPEVYVQFRLDTAGATRVALAGSFTGWRPAYELRETMPGTWSILIPLRPGIHDYAFVVDGTEWVADPHALQIDDGFGGANSRIALPSPPTGSRQS